MMARGASLRWAGPGETAFALAAGAPSPAVARRFESADAFDFALGGEARPEDARAVRSYFASGGKGCRVSADARFADPSWIGEDAGPGARTGLHALAEVDDVGTIALLGPATVHREEKVIDLAACRPEVLFLLEGGAGAVRKVFFLRPNVAVLGTGSALDGEGPSTGALAGYLEASDWSEEVAFRRATIAPPRGLTRADCEPLYAWRRREGLRRSIDRGTRWVLFELSHPPVWRSVARETRAFLYRLERCGFFKRGPTDCMDAWCAPTLERGSSGVVSAGGDELEVGPGHVTVHVKTGAPVLETLYRGEGGLRGE